MQGTYQKSVQRGQFFSMVVDGKFFGTFKDDPEGKLGLTPGDQIEFETQTNDRGYENAKTNTIKKTGNAAGSGPTATQAPNNTANSGMSKSEYWDEKAVKDSERQTVIEHQSSRNAAIHLVEVMLASGAAPIPTKKADQYDAVIALVDTLTQKFNADVDAVRQYGLDVGDSNEVTVDADNNDELEG